MRSPPPPPGLAPLEPKVSFEVVDKQSIQMNSTSACLCEQGRFWHWRIKQCINQGYWGYECGFFPSEHHRFVCADGLNCEVLEESQVKYFHKGAVPASCQHCSADDNCTSGAERHAEECLKEIVLSGEACATVRLTLTATASGEATRTVTFHVKKIANVSANASTKHAGINVTASVTSNHKATATSTATATSKVEADIDVVAEEKCCVTIGQVKEHLGLQDVKRVGPVLAAKIISTGDQMAFDCAYALAMQAAKNNSGNIDMKKAADDLAGEKAAEDATNEAKAKAKEKAAWEAEAGAKDKANADAKDLEDKAEGAAEDAAKNVADVASQGAAKKMKPVEMEEDKMPDPPRKVSKDDFENQYP